MLPRAWPAVVAPLQLPQELTPPADKPNGLLVPFLAALDRIASSHLRSRSRSRDAPLRGVLKRRAASPAPTATDASGTAVTFAAPPAPAVSPMPERSPVERATPGPRDEGQADTVPRFTPEQRAAAQFFRDQVRLVCAPLHAERCVTS